MIIGITVSTSVLANNKNKVTNKIIRNLTEFNS